MAIDVSLQTVEVEVIEPPIVEVEISTPGPQGASGPAGTITVGTVTSIPFGEPATVTNVGTDENAILDFEFPLAEGTTGGLPSGGVTGDVVSKASDDEGDGEWISGRAQGFSIRYGQAVDLQNLEEVIGYIFNFGYQAPQVSLGASGNSLREKGDAVTSSTLTAAITRRSNNIAEVRFYRNPSTLLDTQTSGGGIPSGGNSTYGWTGSFSDTTTFRVEVDDDSVQSKPSASTTTTFNFVYPYYVGAGAPSLSASSVAGLTKRIINSTASRAETITASDGQTLYFAYPATYGALTSIKDVNNFETFPGWTLRTENITGLDGNPVSYRIYEKNDAVIAGSYLYTFIR